MTSETLATLKSLISEHDAEYEKMRVANELVNETQKNITKIGTDLYIFRTGVEKLSTEWATEDQVVDKFCALGDLVNERARLHKVYKEHRKEYLLRLENTEKLKKKIRKIQKQFLNEIGIRIF